MFFFKNLRFKAQSVRNSDRDPLALMRIRIGQNFAIHKPFFFLLNSPIRKDKLFVSHYFRRIKLVVKTSLSDLDRVGSGFNQDSGSGSVFGIRIRTQEGQNDPEK